MAGCGCGGSKAVVWDLVLADGTQLGPFLTSTEATVARTGSGQSGTITSRPA